MMAAVMPSEVAAMVSVVSSSKVNHFPVVAPVMGDASPHEAIIEPSESGVKPMIVPVVETAMVMMQTPVADVADSVNTASHLLL